MSQLPYIGAKLSLLSKSEVRYEGTLYNINAQEAIVALKDVKACGTEGRRKDGPQIHPNPTAFEYVIFKRADIKDIVVIEAAAQEAAAQEAATFEDPAILQSKSSSNFNGNSNNYNYARQHQRHKNNNSRGWRNSSGGNYQNNRQCNNRGGYNNYNNNRRYQGNRAPAGARVGDGKHLMNAQLWNATASANKGDKGEFDFAKNLEKFDKEAELAKLTGDNVRRGEEENIVLDELPEANMTYSQSSFYDNLSNEISDREAGRSTKLFGHEERQLNQETFGATGVQTHRGHRGEGWGGRGGHRGRGGYGGGRGSYGYGRKGYGGGRGGYNGGSWGNGGSRGGYQNGYNRDGRGRGNHGQNRREFNNHRQGNNNDTTTSSNPSGGGPASNVLGAGIIQTATFDQN